MSGTSESNGQDPVGSANAKADEWEKEQNKKLKEQNEKDDNDK